MPTEFGMHHLVYENVSIYMHLLMAGRLEIRFDYGLNIIIRNALIHSIRGKHLILFLT